MSSRIKYGIIAGVTVAVSIIFVMINCFLNSRTDSPEYTIKILRESIHDHDKVKFNSVVDVDRLVSTSFDSFVEGMIDDDHSMSEELKDHIVQITQMLKLPMTEGLKIAIANYVEYGSFEYINDGNSKNTQDPNLMAASEILERTGLNRINFRSIDSIKMLKDSDRQAVVTVKAYQSEIAEEFTFEFMLEKNSNDMWRVVSIRNFSDFVKLVNKMRREQLDKYLDETDSIITKHDRTIREAEKKYSSILSSGSLGKDETRESLKKLMNDVIKKDWETRKQELFNVDVPKAAEPLQNIRIKICDLSRESAELYAKWMSDKKAATVKEADEKRKQVQILLSEEKILVSRMSK